MHMHIVKLSPSLVYNSLELCQKLKIWYLSICTYLVSKNILYRARIPLILLKSTFFSSKCQYFLAKFVLLPKAIIWVLRSRFFGWRCFHFLLDKRLPLMKMIEVWTMYRESDFRIQNNGKWLLNLLKWSHPQIA